MPKVLVLGSGGREHVLVWHLLQFDLQVHCAPGSDAISEIAPCWSFTKLDELLQKVQSEEYEEIIVGPEKYLEQGVADHLSSYGFKVFGPKRISAQLETSKSFAKAFCERHKIPTAEYLEIKNPEEIDSVFKKASAPYVIKASGLAAGKGVWIGTNEEQAKEKTRKFLLEHSSVLVEEFLSGRELSCFYLIENEKLIFLGAACDHKRLLAGDKGPNTGGMGAYSPPEFWSDELQQKIERDILLPTLEGLRKDHLPYRGFLFLGLMVLENGEVRLLEYNCRLGDPETQALMARLDNSLFSMIQSLNTSTLIEPEYRSAYSMDVVLASPEYPEISSQQIPLSLDQVRHSYDCLVFHAGTKKKNNSWYAVGGRILAVTATGASLSECRQKVYKWIEDRNFEKKLQFRTDIGVRLEQNQA